LDDIKDLENKYGIECVTPEFSTSAQITQGEITGHRIDTRKSEFYLHLFAEEFALYPRSLVERSNVRRIALCQDLSCAGHPQFGIAVAHLSTIYLDVPVDASFELHRRRAIHHEFFHALDRRDDSNVDGRWCMLNPLSFRYANAREGSPVPTEYEGTNSVPGFVSKYATTSIREDKAEVFATMMVEPTRLQRLCQADPVVRAKVQRMKEMLAELSPDVDQEFWIKIRGLKRRTE
jgi:hypothetical protein